LALNPFAEFRNSMKNNTILSPRIVALALALSGATALIYEVAATEALFYYFNNNTYSVATVLSTFLLGLALGSLAIAKYLKKIGERKKIILFTLFQFIIGLYALFVLTNFTLIPRYLSSITNIIPQNNLLLAAFSKFIVGTLYLILPTFLFGASFPLATSIIIRKVKEAGQRVGQLYSWDLFGSIAGALTAGFFIMPLAGLKAAFFFGGGLNFASGLLVSKKIPRKHFLILTVLLLIVFGLAYLFVNPLETSKKTMVRREASNENSQFEEIEKTDILYETPSPYGLVQVMRQGGEPALYINHKYQCGPNYKIGRFLSDFALKSTDKQDIQVLVIGLGCGYTPHFLLEGQHVASIDIVEINDKIPALTKYFFESNSNPLKDKRTNLIIDDGFKYLQKDRGKYDLIIVDLEDPSVAHSSPLYTVEGFRLAAQSLKDRGLFEIQGYNGGYEYLKILYHSLKEVFPYVRFAHKETHIFLASKAEFKKENLTDEEKDLLKRLEREKNIILNTMNYPILKYKYGEL